MDWLIRNLSTPGDWPVQFGVTLSSLNKQVFEGKSSNPHGVAVSINSRSYEFGLVMKASITPKKSNANSDLIRWYPSNERFVKINVDGSFFNQTWNGICGGVVRNHLGRFITGFSCNLGGCSIMQAELWGIIKGLQFATTNEFHHVIIELDFEMVINFIRNGCPTQHMCETLLKDITILVKRIFQVHWNHIFREANLVADILAKKGQELFYGLHVFYAPPPDTSQALSSDAMGILRLRDGK
ncbi:hypothetical protein Ahy_A03g014215 [Arachis hypogaea]|uniref:RNase H type-1 domain-containing protein n=1 Tax=Arachis hypogaea TaxID=3818 RepID=A0A445DX79_ARAHY|nr:hypothetical protein Ahy_A03g014215 [Arachis hypogaea]